MTSFTRALMIASAVIALSACSKKAPEELPPAAGRYRPPGRGHAARANRPGEGQSGPISLPVSRRTRSISTPTSMTSTWPIRTSCRSQAQWLAANSTVKVTVEGHADERGTRDYNLALGERRANAAKTYLASLGVDPRAHHHDQLRQGTPGSPGVG
jgi:peptidoglycan-associated lipoprotein